jgi:hypothetical protein
VAEAEVLEVLHQEVQVVLAAVAAELYQVLEVAEAEALQVKVIQVDQELE